jgi:hypothetical protein
MRKNRKIMDNLDTTFPSGADGLSSYEYLVNNINASAEEINRAVNQIITVDKSGQFSASAARFLAAIDHENFASQIDLLLKATIEKDRDQVYLSDLLSAVWGPDYTMHADELRDKDDNFRRIYKRVHPSGII